MTKRRRTLTTGQVAERFGVTTRTVQLWADNNVLKCERLPGSGYRRFDAEYIEQKASGR